MSVLDTSNYDFLRNDSRLGQSLRLITVGGSVSYGTNIDTKDHVSDLDLRGFYTPSKKEVYLMRHCEKPIENRELDVVIYPLLQLVKLLKNSNPNVIEIIATDSQHVLECDAVVHLLRDNVDLFLSRKCFRSFGGYATSNLRRLQNALANNGAVTESEKNTNIERVLNQLIMQFNTRNEQFNMKVSRADVDGEIYLDANIQGMSVREFHKKYSQLANIVTNFDQLGHRNSKKDEVHLLKHAMHLIRLLTMGIEILEGSGVKVYRPDRHFLLDIRQGAYSYEDIFEMTSSLEKRLEYAYKNSPLPDDVDSDKIDKLVEQIIEDYVIGR